MNSYTTRNNKLFKPVGVHSVGMITGITYINSGSYLV